MLRFKDLNVDLSNGRQENKKRLNLSTDLLFIKAKCPNMINMIALNAQSTPKKRRKKMLVLMSL